MFYAGKEPAGVPTEITCLDHPRLVNSAYFSPQTGTKLMTTCIDNRIRVWDYVHSIDKPPDREIVHSHDFNRYLTPFRGEWDPKDHNERLMVVGRYISEDFSGVALHPVDLLDASTGGQISVSVDECVVCHVRLTPTCLWPGTDGVCSSTGILKAGVYQ